VSLEKEVKASLKKEKIQEVVLATILSSTTLAVALIAPKVLSVLGRVVKNSSIQNIKKVTKKLSEKGFIRFEKNGGKPVAVLTEKGRCFLETAEIRNYKFKNPKKWDGKWRVVMSKHF
jgi:DNA-binding PadR family transcriptional regulator